MGKSPLEAARDGTQEVAGAIFAGTVTTLAVFLPAIFLTGMIKYLFEPLSLAATLTIGASFMLALTVVPAFCATFLREIESGGKEDSPADESSDHASAVYGQLARRVADGFPLSVRW